MMKCANFVDPFDPSFRRPAPKRPPCSKYIWCSRLGWYRSRPRASRRDKYPNGSNIKNISSVLWWNAPTLLVHLTHHSDGLPQNDLLVPSTYGVLDWVGIGPVLGQAEGTNIQTVPTSKISVQFYDEMRQLCWSIWPIIQTACPKTTSSFQAHMVF